MPGASKKGHKGFYRKAEKSRGDSKYEPKECVIGIDQSYTRTGISIAVNGKLKKVTSVDFKGTTTKTAKRLLLQEKLLLGAPSPLLRLLQADRAGLS